VALSDFGEAATTAAMYAQAYAKRQANHRFCGLCGSVMVERRRIVGGRFNRTTGERDAHQHVSWQCVNWMEPHPLDDEDKRHDSEYVRTERA
jgi:hypothetical protein